MNYKLIERKNPRNTDGPAKFYAYILNMSEIGIDDLATRISASCTVTRHDCLAVLSALQEQIIYALQEGKRISLGDIGRFRVMAIGAGSDTAESYDTNLIKRLKVCFTPNTRLKDALTLDNKAFPLTRLNLAEEEEGETEEGQI